MGYRAVIFDLGGVVLDSPLHEIARYERQLGVPEGVINRLVVASGPDGAWSRLERGELDLDEFARAFDEETRAAGHERLSGAELMQRIGASSRPRPRMLQAIDRLREAGLGVAALTNNWAGPDGSLGELRPRFDVVVESCVVGMRKPDPRIYRRACAELEVEPVEAVFLDDIGANLKPARALGMATIKVVEPESALGELSELLGLVLHP